MYLHALIIKGRATFAAEDEGVLLNLHMLGENLLAQAIEQKRAAPVQRPATDSLHKTAQQASGQGGFKQHRAFGGGNLAAAQARQRPLGGVAAHRLGAGQIGGVALGAVPKIALHLAIFPRQRRNRCHRQAVARAGITTAKAARMGAEKVALLGRNAGPLAIGDALVHAQCRLLAAQRQRGGLLAAEQLAIDQPGVE